MTILTIWVVSSLFILFGFIYAHYSSGYDLKPDMLIVMVLVSIIPLINIVAFFIFWGRSNFVILKGKRK